MQNAKKKQERAGDVLAPALPWFEEDSRKWGPETDEEFLSNRRGSFSNREGSESVQSASGSTIFPV